MVNLLTTPAILSAWESLPTSTRNDLSLPSALHLSDPISHAQLIQLARYFRTTPSSTQDASPPDKTKNEERTLNALLQGTKLHVPPPPKKPEPSKSYLTHKSALLAAAEADAYNRMLTSAPTATIARESPSIFTSSTPLLSALHDKHHTPGVIGKGQRNAEDEETITPSLVLNIFLSVLITGFSVFWALHSLIPTAGVGDGVKVLVAMGAAAGVGMVEVGIYAIYLRKVRVARGRERRVREVKVLVGREEVGGRGGKDGDGDGDGGVVVGGRDGDGQTGEKEEIWGRGVNGGVRRRVRERWEEKERGKKDLGGGLAEE